MTSTSLLAALLVTPMHIVAWAATPPEGDAAEDPAVADPDAVVDGESGQPAPGGFGTVSDVTTVSNVAAPPPEVEPETEPSASRSEAGMRVFGGYGQTDVGNARAWDHGGAALGAALQWYPFMTKRRRVGLGVELGYAYQGLVRRELPEPADPAIEAPFTKSKVQQHFLALGFALLLRPHPSWFSVQPTAGLGVAFYTDRDLYAGERHAGLVGRSTAFGLSASLALCSAWDIVCVLGGYRWTQRVDARDALDGEPFSVPTQGWYAGLGFDVLRVYARLNAQPAAR